MKRLAATDIETVPDYRLARAINDELDGSTDEEVSLWIREERGRNDFPKPLFHRIVSQSVSFWSANREFSIIRLGEMGADGRDEGTIISDFGDFIHDAGGAKECRLITWNGSSFDLPVIAQRALGYGANLSRYWDQGNIEKDTKWNNYINRYQDAHTDLKDCLAHYNHGNSARLNDMAIFCGLPGKLGVGAGSVEESFAAGEHDAIDHYCDIDTLLTFLIYIRYLQTLNVDVMWIRKVVQDVETYLSNHKSDNPLFEQFLDEWDTELFVM